MSETTVSTVFLVAEWREIANDYHSRYLESTAKREHVIAAQQAGLAAAFNMCANQLEQFTVKL